MPPKFDPIRDSDKSLATKFPDIAAEWHPTKNGYLTPDQVSASSDKKVWWLGKCGHTWDTTVHGRTGRNQGCPFDSGNRLLAGFNDLATKFPEIAAEWHPTKNGDLTPDQILAGSGKKVWWLGKCGHEWDAVISHRTANKTGCPFDSGNRLLAGFNDLATKFPEIAAEWHHTKNGDLTPNQITASNSRKKVWWIGECGHEWDMTVNSRTRRNFGCPFESGQRTLAGFNDLATTFPEIAAEWHPTKNGDLLANQVSASSSKKVWWLGACGHEWDAVVSNRTIIQTDCPFEAKTNARVLAGFNDLATEFPEIAAEWHPTKNGDLTPNQILAGSGKKVWWFGKCGHEWDAIVGSRTGHNQGCPFESKSNARVLAGFNDLATKFPEIAAEWHPTKNGYLTPDQVSASNGKKVWWLGACGHKWDATVASRTGSSRGCPFESGQRTLAGFNDLATKFPEIAAEWHPTKNGYLTPDHISASNGKKVWWLGACGHEWDAVVSSRTGRNTGCPFESGNRLFVGFNDLTTKFPEIAAEWHPTKNGELTPDQITAGSKNKVWWLGKCGHAFPAAVGNRTILNQGCPCGQKYWTNARLRLFIEALRDHLDGMDSAELYTICLQGGLFNSSKSDIALAVTRHDKERLIELLEEEAEDNDDDDNDDTETDGTPSNHPNSPDNPGVFSGDENEIEIGEFSPDVTDNDDDNDGAELPVVSPQKVLAAAAAVLASCDDEAADFLVASFAARIWRSAYQLNPDTDPALRERINNEIEALRIPTDNEYSERVRTRFIKEYDAAIECVPPQGWSFRPSSTKIVAPNLMQRHVATQVVLKRRYGNWSGTGAGKTVSAVLAARLIGAGTNGGIVLVVCPNNVVQGWAKTVKDCYPDSQVETKTLKPSWGQGAGPRWLIINYDMLPGKEGTVKTLIGSNRVDMLVIDEVHYVKEREGVDASQRRTILLGISTEASRVNPKLAVLAMSATPVVNDLHEARSLMEMVEGVKLSDIKVKSTVDNALAIYRRLIRHGTRWMPNYTAHKHEIKIPIDGADNLIDEVRELPSKKPSPSEMDQLMLSAKLEYIVTQCRKPGRTLIYTYYVTGIVDRLIEALTQAGISVGTFTGENKDGLAAFTGVYPSGEKVADSDRVDVLIGSSAISTGVDGLQHVAARLIFATLPWTHAEYMQVVGRIYRQGQASNDVEILIPMTGVDIPKADGSSERWSWCKSRWDRVLSKETLAECAVDGSIPRGKLESPATAAKRSIEWLNRITGSGVLDVERKLLDVQLGEDVDNMTSIQRTARFSELSRMNGAWASANSSRTHARLIEDPTEWKRYHSLYRAARKDWTTVPAFVFANWLKSRSDRRRVADLGCGEMLLADRVGERHEILAFDHVAFDDRVTVCDISEVPLDDATVNIAVLSLALMGKNHMDYVREAHRILPVDGLMWLCEPTAHIGSDREHISSVLAEYGFNVLNVEVHDQFTFVHAAKNEHAPLDIAHSLKQIDG